jgi:hypothetical protein
MYETLGKQANKVGGIVCLSLGQVLTLTHSHQNSSWQDDEQKYTTLSLWSYLHHVGNR